jgi:hypothetical protein
VCHPIEPIDNHLSWLHGSRPPKKHKKRGLKSVLGVVVVAEETQAYAPHHRAVSAYEGGEGGLLSLLQEEFQ